MDLLETFFSSSLVTQIVTQSNKFTELRHGVQQINSICKTQLVRQLGRQATSFLLRRKNPRIDTIRGLCLVKLQVRLFFTLRHGVWQIDSICQTQLVRQLARPLTTSYDVKFYESILFVKLYQWSTQPSSIETWRQLLILLHNQINLLNYDTEFYKSIPFVKLSQ